MSKWFYSALFFFALFEVSSQNDTLLLKQVDVNGARIPSEFNEKNRSVVVISRQEIAEMPVTSLDELLEFVLNTDVRQRGALGVQSDISVRGGSCEQLAIMLNGVKVNDPQTGHHNLNIPLDLNCVSRIEILQGPGTRLYGPGAFSGAINIITSAPAEKGARIQAEGGDFKYYNTNASLFTETKKFSALISAGRKSSGGYRYNTDFSTGNVFMYFKHKSEAGILTAQAGYNDKQFGANSFYSPDYPDQYEQTRAFITSVRFDADNPLHIKPQIYYRRHQDRFELFRANKNAPSWYTGHNYHLTHVAGAEISSWFEWQAGKTSFGGDYRSESVYSNKLGDENSNQIPVPMEENAVFTRFKKREIATLFADHQFSWNKFNCSGGVMGYYSTVTGLKSFPGIDISYALANNLSLFGSYNHSLRLPSFTEMYYTSPVHSANSAISPEEAINTEVGIKQNNTGFLSGLTFYYRDGKNIIDWVRKDSADKWTTANITSVQSLGLEFFTKVYVPHFIKKTGLKSITLNGVYNISQKASEDMYSLYALDYLRYKFSAGIHHVIYRNITASWTLLYQQREGTYTNTEKIETCYNPFCTFDGRISWNFHSIKIYADASNIFNTEYMDIGNLPMPGRWFRAGIMYSPEF